MICQRCAHAADNQLGPEHHCDDQGGPSWSCACQHRTDRYGTAFRKTDTAPTTVVIYIHPDRPHIADAIRDVRRNGPWRR